MSKKFLLALICLICAVCCASCFVACNDNTQQIDKPHQHRYGDWCYNETEHWRECENKVGCDAEVSNVAPHNDTNGDGVCDICNKTLAHVHNLTLVPENPATCTEEGNINYYTCSGCDLWFADQNGLNVIDNKNSVVISMIKHALLFHKGITATCMNAGNVEYYECDECHKYFRDEDGEDEIVDKDSVNLDIVDHSLSLVPKKDATCTESGNSAYYKCGFCDKYFNDIEGTDEIVDKDSVIFDKISHNLTLVLAVSATCTQEGHSAYYECGECHKYFNDSEGTDEIVNKDSVNVAITAHTLDHIVAVEPSCTTNGNVEYYECTVCHDYFRDSNGSAKIEDKDSVIVLARHDLTNIPYVAPDCTTAGNIEYYECGVCHKYFSDNQGANEIADKASVIIPSPGHNYVNDVCSVCGLTKPTTGIIYEDCGEYSIVAGVGSATSQTKIVLEDTYNGKPVTQIKANAFKRCSKLQEIVLPDTITIIGNSAFESCTKLTTIKLPEVVTKIGSSAFVSCHFESIDFPAGLIEIGEEAFRGSRLRNVKLPEGFTTIAPSTFAYCTNLRTISIPASVISIGADALKNCENLLTIRYNGDLAGWCALTGHESFMRTCVGSEINPRTVYVGDQELKGELIIPDGVTRIEPASFALCSFSSITFPSSLQSIGDYAFDNAVAGAITIPEGVKSIGERAFLKCVGFSTLQLPNSLTSLGVYAFSGCSKLTTLTLGSGLSSMGTSAFEDCSLLSSVNIPVGVTSIGERAFAYCDALTSITLPEGLTNIGRSAFIYCKKLENITLPDSITSIEGGAFLACAFTSFTWPSSVAVMSADVFSNCASLTTIIIPKEVTEIKEYAFVGCFALNTLYYGGTEEEWDSLNKNGNGNSELFGAKRYFYSETQPEYNGFWHYDVDGVTPILW